MTCATVHAEVRYRVTLIQNEKRVSELAATWPEGSWGDPAEHVKAVQAINDYIRASDVPSSAWWMSQAAASLLHVLRELTPNVTILGKHPVDHYATATEYPQVRVDEVMRAGRFSLPQDAEEAQLLAPMIGEQRDRPKSDE